MGKRVAITNLTAGVAKTTSTLNLGVALAEGGESVLLVDAAPAAQLCGVLAPTDSAAATPRVVATQTPGVSILAGTEPMLAHGRAEDVAELIRTHAQSFAWVLVDTPPNDASITRAILSACDRVVVPIRCSNTAFRALPETLRFLIASRAAHPELELEGFFLTFVDAREPAAQHTYEAIKSQFPHLAFDSFVPLDASLPRSFATGRAASFEDPKSMAAKAYALMANELRHRASTPRQFSTQPIAAQAVDSTRTHLDRSLEESVDLVNAFHSSIVGFRAPAPPPPPPKGFLQRLADFARSVFGR